MYIEKFVTYLPGSRDPSSAGMSILGVSTGNHLVSDSDFIERIVPRCSSNLLIASQFDLT